MPALTQISRNKAFGGNLFKYSHQSAELSCTMQLNVFLPKEAERAKVPAIYCLAGITCTEDNFSQKSGALREAAKYGLALVFPDTSPSESKRGRWYFVSLLYIGILIVVLCCIGKVNIEGEDDSWDFGSSMLLVSQLSQVWCTRRFSCNALFYSGAGFYLNATQPKWSKHYRMYSYIVDELPFVLNAELAIVSIQVVRISR